MNGGREADLFILEEENYLRSCEIDVWYAGLITAVHTCIVANSEIIYIPKSKGATIF